MIYIIIGAIIIIGIFVSKLSEKNRETEITLKEIKQKNFKMKRTIKREVTFLGDSAKYVREIEETVDPDWEIIYRKSEKWYELGFEDNFPGYGKLYDRNFEVWFCDVGSKEKKDIQSFKDRFPIQYTPKNTRKIVGANINFERLQNSKNYEVLFSGLDNNNRKRWYFGVKNSQPTGIEIVSL
ncbi:hypothetical protein UMM65_11280 [Aureibaculum sp. 2210JD6-5]|uniref:hypothetical protein n=1 Tax=Aureibaculum sp. 2210JD6-5 TaxID=3103957 RepID=UPI002AADB0C2|nr:hypothetical protein [Aureibaculum sp. 2210JD6-5]MDY7395829.1 hypothetical protein [Aureibaculum sp. 2210JD6-5]